MRQGNSARRCLIGRRVAGWERLFRGLVDGLLHGAPDLLFGLEPVIEFRAGLIAALDVEFIRSAADSFPFMEAEQPLCCLARAWATSSIFNPGDHV